MAKKDMHTYVSRFKNTELETLIATYDIPLDLRPRLPDPNFRMINLPAEDMAIDKVPTNFNQNHVDQLKAHIVKLYDIPIHDFLCMPSLDKAMIQEEPHGIDTSILGRAVDRTTSPALAGTAIPRPSLEEIAITRPDRKVLTKADHTAKQKTSTRPEISTNAAKKTRSSKKVAGAGSSGLAAGDEVGHTDDGALDDGDQRDGSEFAMEDIENLNDVNQGVSEDASFPAQEAVPAPDTQPLDTDAGADEIASDGNVDPYYEARVSNNTRDVLERDLLPFVLGPYYIPYPYDKGSKSETTLDRFPTLAETHRLRELSSVELSDQMSVLQCQLITHGSIQTIKKQRVDLKQQGESTVGANEEVSRKYRNERVALALKKEKIKEELVGTKSQLEHSERQDEEIQDSIASFFLSDFTPLVRKFLKSGEFNQAFAGVLNTAISIGVERRLRMDRTDEEFRGVTSSHQPSSATASLRANTHVRHSTSSSGTFGYTSTLEHLKKKKKSVEKGGPSAT
ncbi:hypothetical protein Tco_0794738 [Tanacetum coccineum]